MSLKLIGAGFGRTGTLSMKLALEQLGLGPCYHMAEVLKNPSHDRHWLAATRGESIDWSDIFASFQATVDWPAAYFWRELLDVYPDAKVLLNVREETSWYKSISNTILKVLPAPPSEHSKATEEHRQMTRELILERTFDDRYTDEDHVRSVFRQHNAAVIDAVAPERLLVYQSGDGWEPLCAFLGVDVPDAPYPKTNSTEQFLDRRTWRSDTDASTGPSGN
ncbi:MAG: sulfotransferase family protein [Pseudomonadota bacterium]